MNIQFISDDKGTTTGVFIPIKEWVEIQRNMKDPIEDYSTIPQTHINIVEDRMEEYKANPTIGIEFDQAIKDIENEI